MLTLPDKVSIAPTITGAAKAWRVDSAGLRRNLVGHAHNALLAAWCIEAPWAHGIWHSYALFLGHLRQLPGCEPEQALFQGATHALALFAMDPGHPREGFIAGNEQCHWLAPPNYLGQFAVESDDAAIKRLDHTVREICNGELSPDTDFRRAWFARYGAHYYPGETSIGSVVGHA